tara:strand:+ start:297 stop:590 length:294 start_codon:yes stop_codon:yes gene_type:complete
MNIEPIDDSDSSLYRWVRRGIAIACYCLIFFVIWLTLGGDRLNGKVYAYGSNCINYIEGVIYKIWEKLMNEDSLKDKFKESMKKIFSELDRICPGTD